jgi:hypothetical protein
MTRNKLSFPRQSHLYPSEASVKWVDSSGETRVAGTCLRAVYYRYMGTFPRGTTSPYTQWIFALGKAVENILVEQWKEMGIWVANNVEFYWPEYNIKGELDCIIHEPGTNRMIPIECCTPKSLLLDQNYCLNEIGTTFVSQQEVVGHTGNTNLIEKTFKREVKEEPVYRFRGKFDGLFAEVTGEHPVLTAQIKISRYIADKKKRSYQFVQSQWKPAKDLRRGEYICIPKTKFGLQKSQLLYPENILTEYRYLTDQGGWQSREVDGFVYPLIRPNSFQYKPIPSTIRNQENFYWLLGLYLAEGSCSQSAVYFSLNANEIDIVEKVRNIVKELWNLDIATHPLIDSRTKLPSKGINISISSVALRNLFKSIVPGNTIERTKHLHYEKINGKPELLNQILLGAWNGDGCKASKYQYRIVSAVPHLAYLYFQIAARLGLHPRIKKYKQASQFDSEFIYSVEWSKDSNKKNVEPLIDGDDFWCYKIKKIDLRTYTGEVFNLEASPDNSYTLGTIAVHNCKSFYGYQATRDLMGNTKVSAAPKTSQMLQTLIYLYRFQDQFPYAKMIYYARDSANRTEFDLSLVKEGENKTRVAINGMIDQRFYIENILARYREIEQYCQMQVVPPGDYELQWSPEKIERRHSLGEVAKGTYEKWEKAHSKGKDTETIGDWQCSYCNFKEICFGQGK